MALQRYKPWAYAPRDFTRARDEQQFRSSAREVAEQRKADSKGKSLGSRAKTFALGALDKGLKALDVPAEYTLRPLMGATTYLGADQKTGPNGEVYRESPDWGDIGEGLGKLFTQSPAKSYQEGRQAFRERTQDPGLSGGGRVLLGAVSDPLTYIGPGAIKVATGASKLGRGGAFAAALLESPRAASIGGIAGAAGAAELADRADLPSWAQAGAAVAGGMAGGVAGGRYGSKAGARRVGEDIATAQGRKGRAPALGASVDWFPEWNAQPGMYHTGILADSDEGKALLDSLVEAGVRFGFDDAGAIYVDDADEVAAAVQTAYREAADPDGGVYTRREKGSQDWVKGPGKNFGEADDRSYEEAIGSRRHKSNRVSGEELRYTKSSEDPLVHARLDAAERLDEMMSGGIDPKNEAMRRARAVGRKIRGSKELTPDDFSRINVEYEAEVRRATEAAQSKFKEKNPGWETDPKLKDKLPKGVNSAASNKLARQLGESEADSIARKLLEHEDWTLSQVQRELLNEQEQFDFGRGNKSYKPTARDKAAKARLEEIRQQLMGDPDGFGLAPRRLPTRKEMDAARAKGAGPVEAMPPRRRATQGVPGSGSIDDIIYRAGQGPRVQNPGEPAPPPAPVPEPSPSAIPRGVKNPSPLDEVIYEAGQGPRIQDPGKPVDPLPEPGPPVEPSVPRASQALPPDAQGELPRTKPGGYRGPDAALGAPPSQMGGAPPAPPSGGAPTPPPDSLPGPGRPPKDILQTFTRDEVLARGDAAASSWKAKVTDEVKRAFNKLSEDSDTIRRKVDPFLREKTRIEGNINHFVEWRVQYERARMRAAGLEIRKVGKAWKLFAGGTDVGLADDVIEGTTDAGRAAWNLLSKEQQRALAVVGETNELLNGTKQFHGAEVRIDPDIEGDYFGRRVVERTYEGEGGTVTVTSDLPTGPTRRVGAERTKSRTVQSVEELMAKGFAIDDPWTTRAGVIRGKMLDAEDAYLKRNLEPLAIKDPGSSFGLATVPGHPGFAGTWFTPGVARRIKSGLDSKPPQNIVQAINAVLTPARASYDASATLQQGMRLWLTNPKAAGEYWWAVARSLKDPTVYENYILKLDDRAREAGFVDGLSDLISNDLRYTGGFAASEFQFPSRLTEKVRGLGPAGKAIATGFEASNNHFDRLLNLYRIEFALNQAERLKLAGLQGDDFLHALRESNRGVNRAFGWTANEPTKLESSLLFAPRYTRASVETLFMALSRNSSIEATLARQHLALLLAEGAAAVWAVNAMRGYETDFDPRSNNFLRFRNMGGLDITPFGTYNTLFRAVAQTAFGDDYRGPLPSPKPLWRYGEGKLNPAISLAYWPIKGETYLGEPLSFSSPGDALRTAGKMAESNLPFGVQAGINEGPLAAVLGSTGLSNTPVTPAEKRDFARTGSPGGINLPWIGHVDAPSRTRSGVAQEMFGKPYDELTGAEKSRVNEDERVAKQQRAADKNTLTRNSDRSAFVRASVGISGKLEELGNSLSRGDISGNEYRDQYNLLQAELRGAREALQIDDRGDKSISGWFDLYDQAVLPDGRIDYDTLDALQSQYKAKHPDVEERVLQLVGARDSAVLREYRAAKEVAAAYYEIPTYKGMTVEESRRASQILAEAQDMASYGLAKNMARALTVLYKRDPDGVRLARRAQRLGPNPERKKFRKAHPEMARFYSDVRG